MKDKQKAEDPTTSALTVEDHVPKGPGWNAFSRLFGKRSRSKTSLYINDVMESCEMFVLPDESRIAVTAEPVFNAGKTGPEAFQMEVMFATKDRDEWNNFVSEDGWEFKGNFFASPGDMEGLMSLGKACAPVIAWKALVGEGENQALVRSLLDRVFGAAAIDECLLLCSTAKAAPRSSKRKGPSV